MSQIKQIIASVLNTRVDNSQIKIRVYIYYLPTKNLEIEINPNLLIQSSKVIHIFPKRKEKICIFNINPSSKNIIPYLAQLILFSSWWLSFSWEANLNIFWTLAADLGVQICFPNSALIFHVPTPSLHYGNSRLIDLLQFFIFLAQLIPKLLKTS